MANRELKNLLNWSTGNTPTLGPNGTIIPPSNPTALTPELLSTIMGGPSEADKIQIAMSEITSPTTVKNPVSKKLIAFKELQYLVENFDNANLLSSLGLWPQLLAQLKHEDADMRLNAAWCVGTAVQNHEACQKRLLELGGVEMLVGMIPADTEGKTVEARKKAIFALSSAVRNYQPAMDAALKELKKVGKNYGEEVDAGNMVAVDVVIEGLRKELV